MVQKPFLIPFTNSSLNDSLNCHLPYSFYRIIDDSIICGLYGHVLNIVNILNDSVKLTLSNS